MSKNGNILNYWKGTPQSKNTQNTGSQARSPRTKPRNTSRATPPPPSLSHSPLPSNMSPLAKDAIVVGLSSTPSRGSKTSPDSIPSSPDSFPRSPLHADTSKAWRSSSSSSLEKEATGAIEGAAIRSHGGVIRDSDDDDFDDDDSSGDNAESLQDAVRFSRPLLGPSSWSFSSSGLSTDRVAGAAAAPTSSSPYDGSSTPPLTKRRAATLLTSPLPLRRAKQARVSRLPNPPTHKFDMQALLRHAEQEDATEAAAQRVEAALAESSKREQANLHQYEGEGALPRQPAGDAMQRASGLAPMPLVDGLLDDGGGTGGLECDRRGLKAGDSSGAFGSFNKERLRKAFNRTEVAAVSEQWYFFKEYFVPSPAKRRPFPQKAAAAGSRWAFLRDATMRQDYFMMGVVRKALLSGGGGSSSGTSTSASASQQPPKEARLPDELFLWILNEACMDPLPSLRAEYAAVLRCCPEQVRRFVDAERLLFLFQKLGPRWESIDLSARLELVPAIHRPYPGRDWSSLRSLLHLIATLADSLTLETVSCAVKLLLRLGIDRVVEETPDLLQDYQEALRKLVTRVSPSDWNDFCHDAGSSLYNSVQKPSLRWQVLACLPLDTPACHDLRRRLASVFLFDDAERARQDPHRQMAQGLAKLTVRDDFVLTADTEYADLAALVNLLDAYLDDAGREAVLRPVDPSIKVNTATRDFDVEIDELARRLKVIGRGIEATGGGHVSRLDSKTALERVQIRLTHSVRTRRPGKKSIFDRISGGSGGGGGGPGGGEDDDGGTRPKQQDIRSFFLQRLAKRMEK